MGSGFRSLTPIHEGQSTQEREGPAMEYRHGNKAYCPYCNECGDSITITVKDNNSKGEEK